MNKIVEEQQKITENFLSIIKDYFPNPVVAGGAPRNWYCGLPAADIDIFIADWELSEEIPFLEDQLNRKFKLLSKDEFDTYQQFKVYEIKINNLKFQLIFHHTSEYKDSKTFVIKTFDFNICKCFYENGKVILTKEAMKDFKNKTLSFSASGVMKHNSSGLFKRTQKLQQYFPNFKIQILK